MSGFTAATLRRRRFFKRTSRRGTAKKEARPVGIDYICYQTDLKERS